MMREQLRGLTAEQTALFLRVRADWLRDGRPVSDLLLREDASPADRAAVADAFTPGAGKDYL